MGAIGTIPTPTLNNRHNGSAITKVDKTSRCFKRNDRIGGLNSTGSNSASLYYFREF